MRCPTSASIESKKSPLKVWTARDTCGNLRNLRKWNPAAFGRNRHGHCLAYESSRPFFPMLNVFRRAGAMLASRSVATWSIEHDSHDSRDSTELSIVYLYQIYQTSLLPTLRRDRGWTAWLSPKQFHVWRWSLEHRGHQILRSAGSLAANGSANATLLAAKFDLRHVLLQKYMDWTCLQSWDLDTQ